MDKDILEENIQTAITRMTPNLCEELLIESAKEDDPSVPSSPPRFSLRNRLAALTACIYTNLT